MATPPDEVAPVVPESAASSADQAFLRRIKSLARTTPLHELEAGKVQRPGDWSAYDLRALCLAAMDTTIEHMGLEQGAPADAILRALAGAAAQVAPGQPANEHLRVASTVLEGLLNERDRRQAFTVSYADPTDKGRRHVLTFHLLREIEAADGTIVVRATTEAINLFVGALDLDVEDAQAAAEAVLRSQLARGRLDQAVSTAREARIRSIQFAEKIRGILDATRRDIRQVDWRDEVPRLLEEALAHLRERIDIERQLINTTRETLDRADPTKVQQAAELVGLLEDCRTRHVRLHGELLAARVVFREEQQRQLFAPAAVLPLPDPEADLLVPLLATDLATAMEPLSGFFRAAVGPRPPAIVRLTQLVPALLQPRREHAPDGLELVDPDLEETAVQIVRFSLQARLAARLLVESAEASPRRLSALLAEARSYEAGVGDLVALVALRRFAPEPADQEGDDDLAATGLVSLDDGTPLTDPNFGGADLLVTAGEEEPEAQLEEEFVEMGATHA